MGVFSSLFGRSDNSNTSQDIDINCYIAASCLKALGYTSQTENISNSVIGLVHSQNNNITYTEYYFYEEAIFYLMSSLEAEESYGVINTLKKLVSNDPSLGVHINDDEILKCIKNTCINISKERVVATGQKITLTDSQISELLDQRYLEYKDSHIAQMSCEEPVNTPSYPFMLSPRDHPLKIYLANIAIRLSLSLGLPQSDSTSLALIEYALMASYTASMQAAAEMASS